MASKGRGQLPDIASNAGRLVNGQSIRSKRRAAVNRSDLQRNW